MQLEKAITRARQEQERAIAKAKDNFAKRLRRCLGEDLWQELGITIQWTRPMLMKDEEALAQFTYDGTRYNLTCFGNWAYRHFVIVTDVSLDALQGWRHAVLSYRHLRRDLALFLDEQKTSKKL